MEDIGYAAQEIGEFRRRKRGHSIETDGSFSVRKSRGENEFHVVLGNRLGTPSRFEDG